ncbi:uncharacterized protein CHSO_1975 [Chryseobacterium sp. StRB126]|uniref:hypothetical protein n=1 Tax=Chryseobacterium sp. StRB126 TaxID=878220 RepID=UPI0004E99D8F|nr:hypothetical protein [Chryseobacterium sp. StRB126]BAP31012.1 uncharacterized protein CHSO_1975 [Chryseobacterium sp. StRB126]
MDFIQQSNNWAKGDIAQGQLMIGFVMFFLFPVIILSIPSHNVLLKGMLIPLSLLLVLNLAYGGYLLLTRTKNVQETQRLYDKNDQQTLEKELHDKEKDDKSYLVFTRIWASFVIISVVLYFLSGKDYLKGLSLGFILMFFGLLVVDTHFHSRLKVYYSFLQKATQDN